MASPVSSLKLTSPSCLEPREYSGERSPRGDRICVPSTHRYDVPRDLTEAHRRLLRHRHSLPYDTMEEATKSSAGVVVQSSSNAATKSRLTGAIKSHRYSARQQEGSRSSVHVTELNRSNTKGCSGRSRAESSRKSFLMSTDGSLNPNSEVDAAADLRSDLTRRSRGRGKSVPANNNDATLTGLTEQSKKNDELDIPPVDAMTACETETAPNTSACHSRLPSSNICDKLTSPLKPTATSRRSSAETTSASSSEDSEGRSSSSDGGGSDRTLVVQKYSSVPAYSAGYHMTEPTSQQQGENSASAAGGRGSPMPYVGAASVVKPSSGSGNATMPSSSNMQAMPTGATSTVTSGGVVMRPSATTTTTQQTTSGMQYQHYQYQPSSTRMMSQSPPLAAVSSTTTQFGNPATSMSRSQPLLLASSPLVRAPAAPMAYRPMGAVAGSSVLGGQQQAPAASGPSVAMGTGTAGSGIVYRPAPVNVAPYVAPTTGASSGYAPSPIVTNTATKTSGPTRSRSSPVVPGSQYRPSIGYPTTAAGVGPSPQTRPAAIPEGEPAPNTRASNATPVRRFSFSDTSSSSYSTFSSMSRDGPASSTSSTAWDIKSKYLSAFRTGPTPWPDHILALHPEFQGESEITPSPLMMYYYDETAPNDILLANDVRGEHPCRIARKNWKVFWTCQGNRRERYKIAGDDYSSFDDRSSKSFDSSTGSDDDDSTATHTRSSSYYTDSAFTSVSANAMAAMKKQGNRSKGAAGGARGCCGGGRQISVPLSVSSGSPDRSYDSRMSSNGRGRSSHSLTSTTGSGSGGQYRDYVPNQPPRYAPQMPRYLNDGRPKVVGRYLSGPPGVVGPPQLQRVTADGQEERSRFSTIRKAEYIAYPPATTSSTALGVTTTTTTTPMTAGTQYSAPPVPKYLSPMAMKASALTAQQQIVRPGYSPIINHQTSGGVPQRPSTSSPPPSPAVANSGIPPVYPRGRSQQNGGHHYDASTLSSGDGYQQNRKGRSAARSATRSAGSTDMRVETRSTNRRRTSSRGIRQISLTRGQGGCPHCPHCRGAGTATARHTGGKWNCGCGGGDLTPVDSLRYRSREASQTRSGGSRGQRATSVGTSVGRKEKAGCCGGGTRLVSRGRTADSMYGTETRTSTAASRRTSTNASTVSSSSSYSGGQSDYTSTATSSGEYSEDDDSSTDGSSTTPHREESDMTLLSSIGSVHHYPVVNKREAEKDLGYHLRKQFFDARARKVAQKGSEFKMLPQYSVSYKNYPTICYDVITPTTYSDYFRVRKAPTFFG